MNSKHELILVRSSTNANVYQAAADIVDLNLTKIQWKVPHVTLSDGAKIAMLKTISRNESLLLPFRSWDLYELPALPKTHRHTWSVKTTSQVHKPRYVIVAFQTAKHNVFNGNSSRFDHCNITNLKLYLNNERYPYDDMNLNFSEQNYLELFYMFQNIQQSYYNEISFSNPMSMDIDNFLRKPIFTFDCTRTDESIKGGMVDVRIEIEASEIIAENTTAFCLIIHDNIIEYSPFTGMVHRVL